MSLVTSCAFLSGRPAAMPVMSSSAGGRGSMESKKPAAAVVSLSSPERKSRPLSLCSATGTKGEHSPKIDLPAFNISPVVLVKPVSSPEERWQVKEEAEAVSLWFEVPGLSIEDLAVEIDEDVLVVKKKPRQAPAATAANGAAAAAGGGNTNKQSGARDSSPPATKGGDQVDARKTTKAEAAHDDTGVVYARLLLPGGYSRERVEAELDSGVLRVTIAKVMEHARRRINVEIKVK